LRLGDKQRGLTFVSNQSSNFLRQKFLEFEIQDSSGNLLYITRPVKIGVPDGI
jgi:hypothetical protein